MEPCFYERLIYVLARIGYGDSSFWIRAFGISIFHDSTVSVRHRHLVVPQSSCVWHISADGDRLFPCQADTAPTYQF